MWGSDSAAACLTHGLLACCVALTLLLPPLLLCSPSAAAQGWFSNGCGEACAGREACAAHAEARHKYERKRGVYVKGDTAGILFPHVCPSQLVAPHRAIAVEQGGEVTQLPKKDGEHASAVDDFASKAAPFDLEDYFLHFIGTGSYSRTYRSGAEHTVDDELLFSDHERFNDSARAHGTAAPRVYGLVSRA